jgi:hypothetical protein
MLGDVPSGKERLMTERERRAGSEWMEDNVRDEPDEATGQGKPEESATTEAVEEEERTGGTGGTDNVRDESQQR